MAKTLDEIIEMTKAGLAARQAFAEQWLNALSSVRANLAELLRELEAKGGVGEQDGIHNGKFELRVMRMPEGLNLAFRVTCSVDNAKQRFRVTASAGPKVAELRLENFTGDRVREIVFEALAEKIAKELHMEDDAQTSQG